MHLPWLAQQYERTCADCGCAWRVPRYFARRHMQGDFQLPHQSRQRGWDRRGRTQSRDPVKRGNGRANGILPQVSEVRLGALLAAPAPVLSRPVRGHPLCHRVKGQRERAISQGDKQSTTATPGLPTRLLSGSIGHDLSDSQADSAGWRDWADGMQAEGARVLAGLRSGDGPLSIRVRPSSLKAAPRPALPAPGSCL
jgi:hypothetical protein